MYRVSVIALCLVWAKVAFAEIKHSEDMCSISISIPFTSNFDKGACDLLAKRATVIYLSGSRGQFSCAEKGSKAHQVAAKIRSDNMNPLRAQCHSGCQPCHQMCLTHASVNPKTHVPCLMSALRRRSDCSAVLPLLSDRMHAAIISASVRTPCHSLVAINATSCGGQQIAHAACFVISRGLVEDNQGGSQTSSSPPPLAILKSNQVHSPNHNGTQPKLPISYNLTAYFRIPETVAQTFNDYSDTSMHFCKDFIDALGIFMTNKDETGSVTLCNAYYRNTTIPPIRPVSITFANIIAIFTIRFNRNTSSSEIYSVFKRWVIIGLID